MQIPYVIDNQNSRMADILNGLLEEHQGAQALPICQLRIYHGEILIPAGEILLSLIFTMDYNRS